MKLIQIKEISKKKGKTIKSIADAIDMSAQNLHKCIRENKIPAVELEKIADFLNVPVALFFSSPIPTNYTEYKNTDEFKAIAYLRHTGLLNNAGLLNSLHDIIKELDKPIEIHKRKYLIQMITVLYNLELISNKVHSKLMTDLKLTADEFDLMLTMIKTKKKHL